MDLNWKHQVQRTTCNLQEQLKYLRASYLTSSQILRAIRTAVIPSLAYAFAITPCTLSDLNMWENMVDRVIKD
eukprot:334777-Pelagomonas_calceolata.AAC.1